MVAPNTCSANMHVLTHRGQEYDGTASRSGWGCAEQNDSAHALDALHALPPDLPRKDWVRAGMAAQAAGIAFDDFDYWSSGALNYSSSACRALWRSIKPGWGIGPGTLFKLAAQHGWRNDGQRRPRKAQVRPEEAPQSQRPGAAEVWSRCHAITADHPYILAKQGNAEGLRVVPPGDPLRIAGEPMAGALVVPVLRPDGTPSSMQFIVPPDVAARLKAKGRPGKLNLPGASLEGWFTVGELVPAGTAYICEGIGQAWACWKATGAAGVVCFGSGRVRWVAEQLRQRDPSARLVLVPDVGKETEAATIARDAMAAVASMPDGWPNNSDVNDFAQREGFDALELLLSSASEPPKPEQRYRLLTTTDLRALPPHVWRVRYVLPVAGLGMVLGPSGVGKTFVVLDMLAHIALGWQWFGLQCKAAPVVYVGLEGERGIPRRVKAWEAHHSCRLPDTFRFVLQHFNMLDPEHVGELAAAVLTAGGHEGVIVVDTLNRATPGADENSAQDMSRTIEAAKSLQSLTGALVLLVHHVGKDATRGARGHSSLYAALDAGISVSNEGMRLAWSTDPARGGKAKDGEAVSRLFDLTGQIEVGIDDDGEPITSAVVVPSEAEPAPQARPLTPRQHEALQSFNRAAIEHGSFDESGAFAGLHVEGWRAEFYRTCTADTPEGKKKAFQRVRDGLVKAGRLSVSHDVYRLEQLEGAAGH